MHFPSSEHQHNVQEALQRLTADERRVLIYSFRLLQEYGYSRVTDHDLYTAFADIDYDQAHTAIQALHEKGLVEMHRDEYEYSITRVLATCDLSQEEREVLVAIIAYQHAFGMKTVSILAIANNVREVQTATIAPTLATLVQKGLVTLAEDSIVKNVFAGA